MAWVDVKDESIADRYVLAELSLGRKQGQWVPYEAGIWYYHFWKYSLNKTYGYKKGFLLGYKESGTGDLGVKYKPVDINSCFVDGEEYTEATSLANMIATNKRWWYEQGDIRFYIHIDGFDPPHAHIILIGALWGIANKDKNINGAYYEPRLKGSVTINKSKDPLGFGIIRHETSGLETNNEDGYFDKLKDSVISFQPVDMKYGIDTVDGTIMDYADYLDVGRSYIESHKLDWQKCNMELVDYRKLLSRQLPVNVFDQTTYPYLKDSNVGKSIPLVWGPVYKAPVTCTNEEESGPPVDYSFKLCDVSDHTDGIEAIDQVYVYKDDKWTEVTHGNEDLALATFTLPSAAGANQYKSGQKVGVDFKGFKVPDFPSGYYLDDNSLDVIEDILNTYLSITYNATNYDQTEWAAAKANAKVQGIFLDKPIEISKIIGTIAFSNFADFIELDNGKFTFRIFDRQASSAGTIELNELFGIPGIEHTGANFITKAIVGYAKDWSGNDYRWYIDDTLEDEIHAEYKKYQEKKLETYLTNAADAQALAESYIDLGKKDRGIIRFQTGCKYMDLEIGDTYSVTLDRRQSAWMGVQRIAIIGLSKVLTMGKVDVTGLMLDET